MPLKSYTVRQARRFSTGDAFPGNTVTLPNTEGDPLALAGVLDPAALAAPDARTLFSGLSPFEFIRHVRHKTFTFDFSGASVLGGFQELTPLATLKGTGGSLAFDTNAGTHKVAEWDEWLQDQRTSGSGASTICTLPWWVRSCLSGCTSTSPQGRQLAYLGMGSTHLSDFDTDITTLTPVGPAAHLRYNFTTGMWEFAIYDATLDWSVLTFPAATAPAGNAELFYQPGRFFECRLNGALLGQYTDATHLANWAVANASFSGLVVGGTSGLNASGRLVGTWDAMEEILWDELP